MNLDQLAKQMKWPGRSKEVPKGWLWVVTVLAQCKNLGEGGELLGPRNSWVSVRACTCATVCTSNLSRAAASSAGYVQVQAPGQTKYLNPFAGGIRLAGVPSLADFSSLLGHGGSRTRLLVLPVFT